MRYPTETSINFKVFAITSPEEGSNTNYKAVGQRLVKTEQRFKISGIEIVPVTQTLAHHSVPGLSVLFIYPGACFSKVPIKARKVVVANI